MPTILLLFLASFLLIVPHPSQAEELGNPCKGLRGKELVLCWKKMDPERARGDHSAFHREQNAMHLKWHQEHRDRTDAQVTLDHEKFHQDMVQKHKEFHRSSKPAKPAPKEGLSKKR